MRSVAPLSPVPSTALRLRLVVPPWGTGRNELENDQLQVGGSFIPDDVHVSARLRESGTREVDNWRGRIIGFIKGCLAGNRQDGRAGVRVPAAIPRCNRDVRNVEIK